MAMASSTSPRATNPPRDTRTQLFVGNLPYRVRWQDLKDLFRRAGTVLRADVSLGPDNRSRGYGTVMLATAEDAGRAVDMFNGYTWQTRTLEVRPDRMGEDIAMGAPGFGIAPAAMGVGLGGLAGAGALGGLGAFGTPLVGSLSPVPGSLSGTGTPVAGSTLASPAPTLPRFPGLAPFGAAVLGEDEPGSRPGTSTQASRNLFVGNLPFHIQWQDLKDLFRQAGAVQRADVALGADGRSRGFGTVSFSNEADAERAVRMFNGYEYNGRPLKVHFDKFAPPASSSAPLVGPTATSSAPHSPAALAFPYSGIYGQPTLSRNGSLAQQLLQSQIEGRVSASGQSSLLSSRRPSALGYGYDEPPGADADALSAQLAQKLSLASPRSPSQYAQQQPQQYESQQQQQPPTHIPLPPAIQSPYMFDFLQSGPTTPYDVYDLNTYQRINASMGGLEGYPAPNPLLQPQPQPEGSTMPFGYGATAFEPNDVSPPTVGSSSGQQSQRLSPSESSLGQGSQTTPPAQNTLSASQTTATSPTTSSRSHTTPQQQHHHPAHPGPIALPPPPPVTAFPVPPPHSLSPHHYVVTPPIPGHPMSPMHHPLMGMAMPHMMTPHGLPPITPSMPSFTFLPQPSPGGPPSVEQADSQGQRAAMPAHMQQHVMAYTPFSPGVTMSPGAFWGRPGSGANPFINPAVGAPVRSGPYYGYAQPQQQQHQQHQQHQQQQQDQQGRQQGASEQQEGRPPDGYFPPVPVSMAMVQGSTSAVAAAGEEPAGYFPWMPPPASATSTSAHGTSGLANEILREDSTSLAGATAGQTQTRNGGTASNVAGVRESPGDSDGTATTDAGTSTSTGTTGTTGTGAGVSTSSRATSWHTESSYAGEAAKAQVRAQARALGRNADTFGAEEGSEGGLFGGVRGMNGNGSGNGSGEHKPRAYSAETAVSGGGERIARAGSDPVKRMLRGAS
ncbi:hypothetical protein L227DRAFT_334303 [Lentinus tigrinus ALCF2SS1-6]|uniref:RRM domain-containing protein n=2 Tax=Lentinus tigrinus TaxID=5365 RepID=A0A5C2RW30_9APHY|nr:hypothetical protein L227DRAFT_334303 [Lentinus tigrinus ALCF2SS1-6]